MLGGQEGWEVTLFKPKLEEEAEDQIAAIFEWDENSAKSFLDWEWRRECNTLADALENDNFIKWTSFAFAFLAKRMTYDGIVLDEDLLNPESWRKILLTSKKSPFWEVNDGDYMKSKEKSLINFFNGFHIVWAKLKTDRRGISTIKSFWKKSPYAEEADKYMKLLWKIAWGKIVHEGGVFRNDKGELDTTILLSEIERLVINNIPKYLSPFSKKQ